MMRTLGVRLAPAILTRLFDEMDHNKDGRVEFDEFVEYMVTHGFTLRAATDGPAQIVDSVFDILDAGDHHNEGEQLGRGDHDDHQQRQRAEEDAHQHVVWRGGEGEPLDTQAEEDGGASRVVSASLIA